MPRGVRLSDAERQKIIDLLPSGKSCRTIAKQTGCSRNTVSRIAQSVGHEWGRHNLARAQEAQKAYGAEWRAEFAKRLAERCEALLADFDGEYLVYNFGGRENTYSEHLLEAPPTEVKERTMKAIRLGLQTVLDIDRHDRPDDSMAVVDEWLAALKGERG